MNLKKIIKKEGGITFFNIPLTVSFIVFTFWLLAIKNASMLKWYDEMSLFESNRFFFRQFLYYPGGLLRYAGTFLTQLLYHPMLGSAVLILLWTVIIYLTRITFGLRKLLYPLCILVPFCLFVSVVQLDEAWLSIKSPGYVFFPTLGFIVTLCLYWFYLKVKGYKVLRGLLCVAIPFLYTVAGFFALLAALLCIIDLTVEGVRGASAKTRKPNSKDALWNFITLVLTVVTLIVVPRLYYLGVNGNMVDNDYLYLKGLPELLMESYDVYLWRPFVAAIVLTLIFGLIQSTRIIERIRTSNITYLTGVALVLAAGTWGSVADSKSEQLRATILMLRALERNDWKGMLHIMSLTREPANYSMLVLSNLAKVSLGGESDDLSGYQPFNLDQRHAESFTMTAFVQVPVNYHVGRLNQSYRWAMEHTVQYGKRVYFLKYMVKDALLRGETRLAKKSNDILMSTMFHRQWAEEMNRYIENPKLISENPEFIDVLFMAEEEKKRGN